jgi:hypothetical protein
LAIDQILVLSFLCRYPRYEFVYHSDTPRLASIDRYSPESLQILLHDLYILSSSTFLVCTFSSQVCRLAHELMQVNFFHADVLGRPLSRGLPLLLHENTAETGRLDRSSDIVSLDSFYYYGGGVKQQYCLLADYTCDLNRADNGGEALPLKKRLDTFFHDSDLTDGSGLAKGFSRRYKRSNVYFPLVLTYPCPLREIYPPVLHYPFLYPSN